MCLPLSVTVSLPPSVLARVYLATSSTLGDPDPSVPPRVPLPLISGSTTSTVDGRGRTEHRTTPRPVETDSTGHKIVIRIHWRYSLTSYGDPDLWLFGLLTWSTEVLRRLLKSSNPLDRRLSEGTVGRVGQVVVSSGPHWSLRVGNGTVDEESE